jgi:1-acyl-sn-glycerol-3-phosphate acyltransferase
VTPSPAAAGSEPGPDTAPEKAVPPPDILAKRERTYLAFSAFVNPVIKFWFRAKVEGRENLPASGGMILASNHQSNLDPLLTSLVMPERALLYMAKKELFKGPLGWFLTAIGQIPVRRGGVDREALQSAARVVESGFVLGLFPEGTRGAGRFETIHAGLAWIMLHTKAPVVPVALIGAGRIRRRGGWLPWASPVRIVVGPPLDLPPAAPGRAGRREASERLRRTLQEFMEKCDPAPASAARAEEESERWMP